MICKSYIVKVIF